MLRPARGFSPVRSDGIVRGKQVAVGDVVDREIGPETGWFVAFLRAPGPERGSGPVEEEVPEVVGGEKGVHQRAQAAALLETAEFRLGRNPAHQVQRNARQPGPRRGPRIGRGDQELGSLQQRFDQAGPAGAGGPEGRHREPRRRGSAGLKAQVQVPCIVGPAVGQRRPRGMVRRAGVQRRGLADMVDRRRLDRGDRREFAGADLEGHPARVRVSARGPDGNAVPARSVAPVDDRPVARPDLLGGIHRIVLERIAALRRGIVQDILSEHLAAAGKVRRELVGRPSLRRFEALRRRIVDDNRGPIVQRHELDGVGDDDLPGGIHAPVADLNVVAFLGEQNFALDALPLRLAVLVQRALGLVEEDGREARGPGRPDIRGNRAGLAIRGMDFDRGGGSRAGNRGPAQIDVVGAVGGNAERHRGEFQAAVQSARFHVVAADHVQVLLVLLLGVARPAALAVLRYRLPAAGKKAFRIEVVENDGLRRFDAVFDADQFHRVERRDVIAGPGHESHEMVRIAGLEAEGSVSDPQPGAGVAERARLVQLESRDGRARGAQRHVDLLAVASAVSILHLEGEPHLAVRGGQSLQPANQGHGPFRFGRAGSPERDSFVERLHVELGPPARGGGRHVGVEAGKERVFGRGDIPASDLSGRLLDGCQVTGGHGARSFEAASEVRSAEGACLALEGIGARSGKPVRPEERGERAAELEIGHPPGYALVPFLAVVGEEQAVRKPLVGRLRAVAVAASQGVRQIPREAPDPLDFLRGEAAGLGHAERGVWIGDASRDRHRIIRAEQIPLEQQAECRHG